MSGCGQRSLGFIDDAVGIVGSGSVVKAPTKGAVEKGENGFKRLGDKLAKATKRSEFSGWLSEGSNYDRLTVEFEKYGVRWDQIVEWAKEESLPGADKLTSVGAKRAYERERKRRGAAPKRASRKKPQAQPLSAPPVRMVETEDQADAKARLKQFREGIKRDG